MWWSALHSSWDDTITPRLYEDGPGQWHPSVWKGRAPTLWNRKSSLAFWASGGNGCPDDVWSTFEVKMTHVCSGMALLQHLRSLAAFFRYIPFFCPFLYKWAVFLLENHISISGFFWDGWFNLLFIPLLISLSSGCSEQAFSMFCNMVSWRFFKSPSSGSFFLINAFSSPYFLHI